MSDTYNMPTHFKNGAKLIMNKKAVKLIICLILCCLLGGCRSQDVVSPDTSSDGSIPTNADAAPATISPAPTEAPEGPYVAFSVDSGFYDKAFDLTLSCGVEGAEIYYTLDGSDPDHTSKKYTEPILIRNQKNAPNLLSAQKNVSADNFYIPKKKVDKATIIRAIAYLPDGTVSRITHATYFVGIDREKAYGALPVISIMTDFDNLYDYETGIYVLGKAHAEWLAEDLANASLAGWQQTANFTNSGKEWERPVSVEFFTADGSVGFQQDFGMRIMGGASRNHPQKSLKLIAREEYGKKSLKYDLIPDNLRSDGTGPVTKYKSFVLRNGGNDTDFRRVRDPYLQLLAEDCRFETQSATPCIAFLNGEFWGIYSITEDYSDNYFENNYGVDNNNVILVKCGEIEDGEESDLNLFHDMYRFITGNDMSDPGMYEAAGKLIDLSSFIDYFAFELYVANEDSIFENNNWRMWRVRETDETAEWMDGRWRMAAYDTDYSTGIYSGAASVSADNLTARLNITEEVNKTNTEAFAPIALFHSLMENKHFREELILALCDMRNIYFEPENAKAVLNDVAKPYVALMPKTYERFGPDWIANQDTTHYITSKIDDLKNYMSRRYVVMPNLISKVFDLSSPVKLTVEVEDSSMGTVLVNNRSTHAAKSYSGMYFKDLTLTLTAVPAEGFRFVGWETTENIITDKNSDTVCFQLERNTTIKAVFEKNQ